PMDQSELGRAAQKLVRPVEGRVAATDDQHALTAERLRVGDAVEDAATVPRLGRGLREPPRRGSTDPGGDQDGPCRETIRFRDEREAAAVILQSDDTLIQMDPR